MKIPKIKISEDPKILDLAEFRPRTVLLIEMATGCGVEPAAIHIIKQI